MTDIRTELERHIKGWESLGHPAIGERFVLRNGKPFTGMARPKGVKQAQRGLCFANSSRALDSGEHEGVYVEGYALRPGLILTHHGWIGQGDKALDLTWDRPEEGCQYFGVEFPDEVRHKRQLETGYYGLFDIGRGLEIGFMFSIDPELKTIVEKIVGHEIELKAA